MKLTSYFALLRPAWGDGYKSLRKSAFVLLMAIASALTIPPAQAEEAPPALPGMLLETGTSFALTASDYLNISVTSTEEIELHLNSFPTVIEMQVIPTEQSGASTLLTVSGLAPDTTYWMYEDDTIEPLEIVSDSTGRHEFSLDLSAHRHLRIQPGKSTYYLYDDTSLAGSTGGDCAGNVNGGNGDIGTWDATTRTCTLHGDLYEGIRITDPDGTKNGITLDGNGYTIHNTNWGAGVEIRNSLGTVVKNVTVEGDTSTAFGTGYGFFLNNTHDALLTHNNIVGTYNGIFLSHSSGNTVQMSSIDQVSVGIVLTGVYSQSDCEYGLLIWCGSSSNIINENSIAPFSYSDNYFGIHITLGARSNIIKHNTISSFKRGIFLYDYYCDNLTSTFDPRLCPSANTIYQNNLISNSTQIEASFGGSGSVFNLSAANGGGNYYDTFDEPGEGCSDTDLDGFCDAARPVIPHYGPSPHYTDVLPWTLQDGWVNSTPVADAGGPYSVNEGSSVTLDASGSSDPDGDALTYDWDLDNDGTFDVFDSVSTSLAAIEGPATRTVALEVTDTLGLSDSDTATVQVLNVAPTITGLTDMPTDPIPVGTTVSMGVTFTDPGTQDTHTESWNWGDGSATSSSGSHTYNDPGIYLASVTVTDDDGGADSHTEEAFVVVYDPNGGFVTGGGWIQSPVGAYTADPGLTGRANFGFVSKYKKGATVPTGETEFQFKAGELSFRSTSYEWLVISGNRAQFKGEGTINDGGSYKFMLTAIDDSAGDKFRIKITDMNDNVVYDNQQGDSDDAGATTAISGGQIVIHTKGNK